VASASARQRTSIFYFGLTRVRDGEQVSQFARRQRREGGRLGEALSVPMLLQEIKKGRMQSILLEQGIGTDGPRSAFIEEKSNTKNSTPRSHNSQRVGSTREVKVGTGRDFSERKLFRRGSQAGGAYAARKP